MSETFTYSCLNCGAQLEVPVEYCGMEAECTECATAFVLPSLEEVNSPGQVPEPAVSVPTSAPASAPEPEEDDDELENTGTIKIDRASIGMIPDVKDQFKVDFGTMDSNPKIDAPPRPESESPCEDMSDLGLPPKPTKKWWQFWK